MKYTLYALFLFLTITSCQQRMYFPDRVNTPGLREAYETKLTLSLKPQSGGSSDSNIGRSNPVSFAADLAFAPVNHLAVFGSYRSLNHRVINSDASDFDVYGGDFTGSRWEGGLGYFTTFDRLGKFEVCAGYGQGKIARRAYYTPDRDYKSRYYRYFLQPAIGAGNHMFSASGGLRFTLQHYYDFYSANPNLRYTIMDDDGKRDVEKETMAFIEPFINGEVGWKYIKFNLQLGCTGQVMGGKVSGGLPFYLSFGLMFHLAPSYLNTDGGGRSKRSE